MKKLYKGSVVIDMVVLAENEEVAKRIMKDNYKDEVAPSEPLISVIEIKDASGLPTRWNKNCVPWGAKNDCEKTIKECFDIIQKIIELEESL